jgi:hypothetical protein
MTLRGGAYRSKASELAVDNWAAARALLRHHAQLLEGSATPSTLQYLVPPAAPIFQEMIDHLEVPDTSHWQHPADEWVVLTQSLHHRDAGWMARLVDLPTVAQAMLPEWQERWRRSLAHWSGNLLFITGDESFILHIEGSELRLVNSGIDASEVIPLTPELFTQVLFGYRSIASTPIRPANAGEDGRPQGSPLRAGRNEWDVHQSGTFMRDDLLSVLNVLFPTGHCWIPASDWF